MQRDVDYRRGRADDELRPRRPGPGDDGGAGVERRDDDGLLVVRFLRGGGHSMQTVTTTTTHWVTEQDVFETSCWVPNWQ